MISKFFKNFKTPPKETSLAPFWFLNDSLEPEHLRFQLREMCDKGVYECILHARKGLTVPYLSEEWFERIGVILEEAEKLGMRVFIYDEDNWPSGYAGGRVVNDNPEFAARCLTMEKIYPILGVPIEVKDIPDKPIVAVIASHKNEEFFDITGKKEWSSPELQYEVFVFRTELCGHRPAYSSEPYVNLMNKKATEKFIAVTHAEYKKRFPQHWGSTIKGFFTDEPGFYQNYLYQAQNLNTIPWTDDFPQQFKNKKGYDILPFICSIWDDMGELSTRTRLDFFEVMTEIYKESFFAPLQEFLKQDGLISIGHIHMEEHLDNTVQMEGDFFKCMECLDYAGIDRISRERNQVTEKLGASAMHLQGKKYCFSETYGCFGWGLTLEEAKRELDWQYVQGVNKMIPHAFFSSIEGFRVNECPPSMFYQNTFWQYFKQFADYTSRLSYALSEGSFKSSVMVYYPIKSCYQLFKPLDCHNIKLIDEAFIELSQFLLKNQIDFDYIYDEALTSADILNGGIKIGDNTYKVVIIPPCSLVPKASVKALKNFAENGGIVIDLSQNNELESIPQRIVSEKSKIPSVLKEYGVLDFSLLIPNKEIKYQHRKYGSDDIYFVINESGEEQLLCAEVEAQGECFILDALSGESRALYTVQNGNRRVINYGMKPYESVLFYFNNPQCSELPLIDCTTLLPNGSYVKGEFRTFDSLGVSDFSGVIEYQFSFELLESAQLILDFGEVYNIAEVTVNGKLADTLLWHPYRTDISEFVNKGINNITVKVSNTPSNALTEEKLTSGLCGNPKLLAFKKS